MSEAKNTSSFMQQLDRWTDLRVVLPLSAAWGAANSSEGLETAEERRARVDRVVANIKMAIREKVLESFLNGRKTRTSEVGKLPNQQRSMVPSELPIPR